MPSDRSNEELSKITSFQFFCGIHSLLNLKITRVVVGHQPDGQGPSHHILKRALDGVALGEFRDFSPSFSNLIWSLIPRT